MWYLGESIRWFIKEEDGKDDRQPEGSVETLFIGNVDEKLFEIREQNGWNKEEEHHAKIWIEPVYIDLYYLYTSNQEPGLLILEQGIVIPIILFIILV